MAASLFAEGLIENNIDKLLKAPKSYLHNHSTKGCRLKWVERGFEEKIIVIEILFLGFRNMFKMMNGWDVD